MLLYYPCVVVINIGCVFVFFFFNDTATTEIYTLSLHDALPIYDSNSSPRAQPDHTTSSGRRGRAKCGMIRLCPRSEEHTSELQSRQYLVCRLLLEKKKNTTARYEPNTPHRRCQHEHALRTVHDI